MLPALWGARGAALGEPVADDLRYLEYVFFAPRFSLFDQGGLEVYWRPLARQVYFALLGPVLITRPGWVAAGHALMLAATAVLLYRTLRTRWPGSWAAAAAAFPFVLAPVRMLITWPSNFQDLGALFFSVLALHEAAFRRLPGSLAALLGGLLCKELAVVTAVLLPWMPGLAPGALRARARWTAAVAALVAAWGAVYVVVWRRSPEMFPRDFGENLAGLATPWLERFAWVARNTLADAFNLAAPPPPWPAAGAAALAAIAAVATVCFVTRPDSRARARRSWPWIAWGLVWCAGSLATLPETYPHWAPYRILFAMIGLGVALTVALAAAHPALLAAVFVVRLAALATHPGAPELVSVAPTAFEHRFDFPRLARHQLMMRETRELLQARHPTLPTGACVSTHHLPLMLGDVFESGRAFRVWYRDATLRWVGFGDFRSHPELPVAAIVQFQLAMRPQLARIEPAAMRRLFVGLDHMARREWHPALAALAEAESLQPDSAARVYLAMVAAKRALCFSELGEDHEAEREAERAGRRWAENGDSRYVHAQVMIRRGELRAAGAQLDTLLAFYPGDAGARALRDTVLAALTRAPSGPD